MTPTMPHDDDREAARQLASMFAATDRLRRVLGRRASLGTADMRALGLFADGRPRTLREIADELGLEQSTVNRQVNAAIKADLLTRSRTASGPYRFTASARGAREFEENLNVTLDAYRGALETLGPRREELLDLLAQFVAAADAALSDAERDA